MRFKLNIPRLKYGLVLTSMLASLTLNSEGAAIYKLGDSYANVIIPTTSIFTALFLGGTVFAGTRRLGKALVKKFEDPITDNSMSNIPLETRIKDKVLSVDPTANNGIFASRMDMQRPEYQKDKGIIFKIDGNLQNEYLRIAYDEIKSGKTDSAMERSNRRIWLSKLVKEVSNGKYEVLYSGNTENCRISFKDKSTNKFTSKWNVLNMIESKMENKFSSTSKEYALAI